MEALRRSDKILQSTEGGFPVGKTPVIDTRLGETYSRTHIRAFFVGKQVKILRCRATVCETSGPATVARWEGTPRNARRKSKLA